MNKFIKLLTITITLLIVLILLPNKSAEASFVYERTPSDSGNIPSPITIRIQGIFGVDFCNSASIDYFIGFLNTRSGSEDFSIHLSHAQGDVVADTFQVSLVPDTYRWARLFCTGFPGAERFLEGNPQASTNIFTIIPSSPTIITASPLSTVEIGRPYSQILQASGGTPPYLWSIINGNLPPGLALDSSTGKISGIPTNTGTFVFTVKLTDLNFQTSAKELVLTITPQSLTGFIYTRTPSGSGNISSPLTARIQGVFGVDFCGVPANKYQLLYIDRVNQNQFFSGSHSHAQGDVVDDTFQVSLPLGDYIQTLLLCFSGSTHIGTVLKEGSTDGSITIFTIVALPIITTSSLSEGTVGATYSQILQTSGGTAPFTWSISVGNLPNGLFLNPSTGEISGTPTTVETANFTVQVTDANNNVATKDLSITVHGNTPIGSDVVIGPLGGVTLTFNQVTQEGQTTIASSSSGTNPPSGFKLGSPPTYYNISTTAQFVPPVEVCVNYDESTVKQEKNLKLFHFENGQWVNITTSLDTVSNIICGEVSSFSELALFENLDIDYLINEVKDFNLDEDVEQGLLDKLTAAKAALERGKTKTAINILKAFANQVKAQKSKKIINEQADILLTDVNEFIKLLSGVSVFTAIKLVLSDLRSRLFGLLSFGLK